MDVFSFFLVHWNLRWKKTSSFDDLFHKTGWITWAFHFLMRFLRSVSKI